MPPFVFLIKKKALLNFHFNFYKTTPVALPLFALFFTKKQRTPLQNYYKSLKNDSRRIATIRLFNKKIPGSISTIIFKKRHPSHCHYLPCFLQKKRTPLQNYYKSLLAPPHGPTICHVFNLLSFLFFNFCHWFAMDWLCIGNRNVWGVRWLGNSIPYAFVEEFQCICGVCAN